MANAYFRISQDGSIGEYNSARRDMQIHSEGGDISLQAAEQYEVNYYWEVVSYPDVNSFTLLNATTANAILRLNTIGSYIVKLTVNEGRVTKAISSLFLGVPLAGTTICLPAFNETTEDNSAENTIPNGPVPGWAKKLNELLVAALSKNYVLTKNAVESVLTGEISTHTHPGGSGGGEYVMSDLSQITFVTNDGIGTPILIQAVTQTGTICIHYILSAPTGDEAYRSSVSGDMRATWMLPAEPPEIGTRLLDVKFIVEESAVIGTKGHSLTFIGYVQYVGVVDGYNQYELNVVPYDYNYAVNPVQNGMYYIRLLYTNPITTLNSVSLA